MLKIGDWVTQYQKGFWQIVDIKPKYADEDYSSESVCYKKGDLIGSWVLMKKGFTPKMKFRIESSYCDSAWCKPVSSDVLNLINQYFQENPADYKKFAEAPFKEEPAVCTNWINLNPHQIDVFEQAIKELPPLFTRENAMKIFEYYNLESCFTKPPSNYIFVCYHTVWELDEYSNPLFKKPELRAN